MNWIKKHKWILLAVILSVVLRFHKIDTLPALNADEASIGYNVYSLLETGKDEHGNPWPVHFQSFNDYKPGGYFYMAMPFIAVFGLSEITVRLPGVLLGVLTVVAIYLLTKEIRPGLENLASLLLAISPWHIHFSRGAWEVNAATFFISIGVYFFLRALRRNEYFAISVIFFVMSLYTYHAARVVVPLLGLALLIIYRKDLFSKTNFKFFLGSLFLAAVLLVPLLSNFAAPAGARASGVSILADRGYIDRINEKRGRYEDPNSLVAKLSYNKPKELFLEFSNNYFEHFWGEFLFISGDEIQRNKVPEFGQLYLWQSFALFIAFLYIARWQKNWPLVVVWLLLAPIPAALTFQSPHALRAQNMIIPLTIISAFGLAQVVVFLKEKFVGKKIIVAACCFFIFSLVSWEFARYMHQYYVHMVKTYPYSSQYGLKELNAYTESVKNDYTRVQITTRYDQPYIMFLFYKAMNDEVGLAGKFQENHILSDLDKYGFSTVPYFDKYIFESVNFEKDKLEKPGYLLIGTDEEIPDEANIIKEVYGDNGFLYFQVVAN